MGAPVMQVDQYSRAKSAKTMGILSVVFSFFIPLAAWIFGGIGISKAKAVADFATAFGDPTLGEQAKSARTLCIIGIVIGIVRWIIAVIMIFANS